MIHPLVKGDEKLMESLSREELHMLAARHEKPCVSLFMPTHRVVSDIREDQIRLKNLLRRAEKSLAHFGLRNPETQDLLTPAKSILHDTPFWQHQKDGLALFVSAQLFRSYQLPFTPDERVMVAHRFHLKPLIAHLSGDVSFYILTISKKSISLYHCSRSGMNEIELTDVPRGLPDALKYDDFEKQLQFHTGTQGTGQRPAIFHGHGGPKDWDKKNLMQYLQLADRGLHQYLKDKNEPLVLAGMDYLLAVYREVTTYPYLLESEITGNPQAMSKDELYEKAWATVHPPIKRKQEEAANHYHTLVNTDRCSCRWEDILPAALEGRVEVLFVNPGVHLWARVDPNTHKPTPCEEEEPGAEDIFDLITVQVYLHRATIYVLSHEEMPDQKPLAAIFRY